MRLIGKGTTGDAFLFNCILYNPERDVNVTVEQYICPDVASAEKEKPAIQDIFSLSSNVTVTFIDEEEWETYLSSLPDPFIRGHPPGFRPSPNHCSRRGIFPTTPYPKFSFPGTDHDLEQDYVVCSPKAGYPNRRNREVGVTELDLIINDYPNQQFVFVGKEEYEDYANPNVLNLIGKTSLLEAMGIVARANKFIGVQGLMAFAALSQKVPSVVYTKTRNHSVGFMARLFPQWINYCTVYTASQAEDPVLFKAFMESSI
jgi:hypothetical protein